MLESSIFFCQLFLQKWYEELTQTVWPVVGLDPPRTALKYSRIRPQESCPLGWRWSPDAWSLPDDAPEMVEDAAGVPQRGEDLQGVVPHHIGGGRVEVVPVIVDPVLRREDHCWVLREDVDCSEKLWKVAISGPDSKLADFPRGDFPRFFTVYLLD